MGSIPAWAGQPSQVRGRFVHGAVYPRVGGATFPVNQSAYARIGLSPRGRGNQEQSTITWQSAWSIPAWAGQPTRWCRTCQSQEVYPRVGGATLVGIAAIVLLTGLSPRGRGNQCIKPNDGLLVRSIPAWAGQPAGFCLEVLEVPVYPRVGGATSAMECEVCLEQGLSPRGRGNLGVIVITLAPTGSIPAWAGQPDAPSGATIGEVVYPRVGGATRTPGGCTLALLGLSPRGRGNPSQDCIRARAGGSIPAWAGQPNRWTRWTGRGGVYPRVGGATELLRSAAVIEGGLSPRGRGNPPPPSGSLAEKRSIPAWAGQPDRLIMPGCHARGLSPRGRGNPWSPYRSLNVSRSIPAWAGQPSPATHFPGVMPVYPRVGGATPHSPHTPASAPGLSPRGRGNRFL